MPRNSSNYESEDLIKNIQNNWHDRIVDAVPLRDKRTTDSLLNHIRSSELIKWDRDGRLVVDGVTYQDTKALDLVHALIRRRKNIPNPKGIDVFLKALTDINTPLELIPNAGVFASPTKDVTPVSTPVRNAGVFAEPIKDLTSDSMLAFSKHLKNFMQSQLRLTGFHLIAMTNIGFLELDLGLDLE